MRKKDRRFINLLELTPAQRVPWETDEQGTVIVLVPKFESELLKRWIMPHLRYPNVRVKLDKLGSFVWKQCDGNTTVATIVDRMEAEFGNSLQGVQDRIRTFLLMLERSELVNLINRQIDVPHQ